VTCPNCGVGLRVDDSHGGEQGKCPKCGAKVWIPFPEPTRRGQSPAVADQRTHPRRGQSPAVAEKRTHPRRKRLVLFVVVLLGILAVTGSIVLFLSRQPGQRQIAAEGQPAPIPEAPAPQVEEKGVPTESVKPSLASVKGGAWLVRGSGSSEVIRGMRVTLVRPSVPKRMFVTFAKLEVLPFIEIQVASTEKTLRNAPSDDAFARLLAREYYKQKYDEGISEVQLIRKNVALIRDEADDKLFDFDVAVKILHYGDRLRAIEEEALSSPARAPSLAQMEREYRLDKLHPNDVESTFVRNLVESTSVTTTSTGIDGTYRIEGIQAGRYFLYASYSSSSFFVEWVFSLDVDKSGEHSQDLSSENASLVVQRR
jgi:Zn-finger nucleic acid-binding protein